MFSLKEHLLQVGTAMMCPALLTWSGSTPNLSDHSQQFMGVLAPPISGTVPPMAGLQLSIGGKVLPSLYRCVFIQWIVAYWLSCILIYFDLFDLSGWSSAFNTLKKDEYCVAVGLLHQSHVIFVIEMKWYITTPCFTKDPFCLCPKLTYLCTVYEFFYIVSCNIGFR